MNYPVLLLSALTITILSALSAAHYPDSAVLIYTGVSGRWVEMETEMETCQRSAPLTIPTQPCSSTQGSAVVGWRWRQHRTQALRSAFSSSGPRVLVRVA